MALIGSDYNIVTALPDGRALVYNSLTSATALLDAEEAEILASTPIASPVPATTLRALRFGGFVKDEATDELSILRRDYDHNRYDPSRMTLTIAPTMACNLGCTYCFQGPDKPTARMSDDVRDAITAHVRRRATRLRRLHVAWYGGEPLMGMDVIRALSADLMAVCAENDITYDAMIVTNGYLLTPGIARELAGLRVTTAQITLDGQAEDHDRSRPMLSGRGSYRRIIENLKQAVGSSSLRYSIRANVSAANQHAMRPLLHELHEAGFARPWLTVYFAPVEAITSACKNVADTCLSKRDYAQLETQLQQLAQDLDLAGAPYPARYRGLCAALRPEGLVVLPDGSLHKCWDTVSMPQYAIGSIFTPDAALESPAAGTWHSWTPFDHEACRNCKLLPACMGSCAHKFLNSAETFGEAARLPCPSWKYQAKERFTAMAIQRGVLDPADLAGADIHTDPTEICIDGEIEPPAERRRLLPLMVL